MMGTHTMRSLSVWALLVGSLTISSTVAKTKPTPNQNVDETALTQALETVLNEVATVFSDDDALEQLAQRVLQSRNDLTTLAGALATVQGVPSLNGPLQRSVKVLSRHLNSLWEEHQATYATAIQMLKRSIPKELFDKPTLRRMVHDLLVGDNDADLERLTDAASHAFHTDTYEQLSSELHSILKRRLTAIPEPERLALGPSHTARRLVVEDNEDTTKILAYVGVAAGGLGLVLALWIGWQRRKESASRTPIGSMGIPALGPPPPQWQSQPQPQQWQSQYPAQPPLRTNFGASQPRHANSKHS